MKSLLFLCVLLLCVSSFTNAQIRLPAIISDNMILQQQSNVTLWGWASPGERITIKPSWADKPVGLVVAPDGKWMTHIKTTSAGGPYTLTFSGKKDSIRINNILLGEVWLASGQSNMEFFI